MDSDLSPVSQRSKRQKIDKAGRFAALAKLKQLKGSKHKYEVAEIDNVYEEVDEKEYTKKVLQRQDEDWIIDDDGCGYVEDGREIFDDDLDEESIQAASRRKGGGKRGRAKESAPPAGGNSNIRNMLLSIPSKKNKKAAAVKLDEDEILGDIIQEISGPNIIKPLSTLVSRRAVNAEVSSKNYLQTLAAKSLTRSKTKIRPMTPRRIDVDTLSCSEEESSICDMMTPSPKKCPARLEVDTMASQNIDHVDSNDGFPDSELMDEMNIETFQSQEAQDEKMAVSVEKNSSQTCPDVTEKFAPTSVVGIEDKPVEVSEKQLLGGWETVQGLGPQDITAAPAEVKVDPAHVPLTTTDSGDKVLRLFWLDAFEDPFKQPGSVFLFGKVWIETAKAHVSCCVAVRNIERRVYLLPREKEYVSKGFPLTDDKDISIMDVYQEFNSVVAPKYNIREFKSRKVERNYCFDAPDVPFTSEYLEVKYSASHPALPTDLSGRTYSRVFGSNTGPLELLLLDRHIRGPCWLDVTDPQLVWNPISWCKVEVICSRPEDVCVSSEAQTLTPPPLVVVTLNIRTVISPKMDQSEVVMLGCLVHHHFPLDCTPPQPPFQQHFCVFSRPSDAVFPFDLSEALPRYQATKAEGVDSERTLLSMFLAKLFRLDPDLVVGHDLSGYGLEILVHRLMANKIPNWSKLGRLRRALPMPNSKTKGFQDRNFMCGRLVCDVKISAKELIRARSYELGTLCKTVLKVPDEERVDLTFDDVRQMYSSSCKLLQLISLTMQDAAYTLRLMCELNVLPLALQITSIAGNVLSRTLMGGRSERNEFLLLHAFTERNFIVPDKQFRKAKLKQVEGLDGDEERSISLTRTAKGRRKPAYSGGLVLEPKKGFYDKLVLLMDFNSLYPSIIQEYNICFTTVACPPSSDVDEEVVVNPPEPGLEPGVLPTEIRKLVESRCEVKKLLKAPDLSPDLKLQYNIRQMALKLTANSMYGCLGFSYSRFYAKPLAALVTAKGREILVNTKELVQKLNYDVIYGDTDSIMINTNCLDLSQVFKIGQKIKQEVNRLYQRVELEIDGVFKYLLLLKKKKYAAVLLNQLPNGEVVTQEEHKGLDIVRRDWSQLSAEAGKFVLHQILSEQGPDERIDNIHAHLASLREDMEEGRVPLQLLTISRQLTKSVEQYSDIKGLPHVQVAARLNSSTGRRFKAGDTVEYVICEDGSDLPATQRAYHVDELKVNENLKVDIKYYLAHQIHPVVSRLCDPIDGTDAARIADCLGLDPSSYHRAQTAAPATSDEAVGESVILSDEERFKYCDRFKFHCMNDKCGEEMVLDSSYRITEAGTRPVLEHCTNPACTVAPIHYLASIQNRLVLAMRQYVHRFYENWLVCEDPGCPHRTRLVPQVFLRSYPVCSLCNNGIMYKEYSDKQLYTQLSFFQNIFDLSKTPEHRMDNKVSPETELAYSKLREQVERVLKHSAYSVVDLGRLFDGMSGALRIK